MEDMCVREVKTLYWEKTQSSWKVGNKEWRMVTANRCSSCLRKAIQDST